MRTIEANEEVNEKEHEDSFPKKFLHPWIEDLKPYQPGLQQNSNIKLNTNENLFPFPEHLMRKEFNDFASKSSTIHLYPDPSSQVLRQTLANHFKVLKENVLVGNGSDNILSMIFRAVKDTQNYGDESKKKSSVATSAPTYGYYACLAQSNQLCYQQLPLKDNWHIDFPALQKENANLTILSIPNSPTGLSEKESDLRNFIRNVTGLVLIDAAYDAFAENEALLPNILHRSFRNLMVCGTFSKSHSLAGLRVGWLIADAQLIDLMDRIREPYNVNLMAQKFAVSALNNHEIFAKRIKEITTIRDWFAKELQALDFAVLPSRANFIFVRMPEFTRKQSACAQDFFEYLQEKKILIRYFESPRTQEYVRISIGSQENMEKMLDCSKQYLRTLKKSKNERIPKPRN